MKKFLYILVIFVLSGCADNKVYWCGDHPCINDKERAAYFKKTLIVEIKNLKKKDIEKNSDMEKILEQAKKNEKKRIITEKELAKKEKKAEKKRLKEEKKSIKQARLNEKKRLKEEKKLKKESSKKSKKNINKREEKKQVVSKKDISISNSGASLDLNEFSQLVQKILNKNEKKPYPDINKIPN